MDLVRVAVLASLLGAPAAAEIIKPWREWLCNYCAMGEAALDNIACSDVSCRHILGQSHCQQHSLLKRLQVENVNFQRK